MADAKHFRHISDIDVWLTSDRSYFVFILLSVFCGFFALDHIYLRSFDTAFQKIFYNVFGLGFWYFWDLIQIFTSGEKIQKEGLTGPFDWIQGIGRGVFFDSSKTSDLVPKKSYIIWAFLAIFGGIFAFDKFYIGDYWHGAFKLFSVFSIFVLFGLFWVAWDAFHAFFMTKDVLSGKISLPFPLSYFGFNETDSSIFFPQKPESDSGWFPFGNPTFGNAFRNVGINTVKPAVRLWLGNMLEDSLAKVAGKSGVADLKSITANISSAIPTQIDVAHPESTLSRVELGPNGVPSGR